MKITSNYLKNTYMLDKYLYSGLTLYRFSTVDSLIKKIDNDFKFANLKVKDFDYKSDYDNTFQDYELTIVIGNEEEDLIDLTIYYATTRIGERIVVETSYEVM